MTRKKICAVLTAHNRRETTLTALRAYFSQSGPFDLRAVLLDDGSTDGTGEAVATAFPAASILRGDGSRFWNRGMAEAFRHARKSDADYFLWLNDDTTLLPGALENLVATAQEGALSIGPSIVIGSTCDGEKGAHTYGGVRRTSEWHPGRFALISPVEGIRECDTMNGNIVLIHRGVADLVGGIDESFTHGMGDYDYGLSARRKGVAVIIGPGFQGICERNPPEGTWQRAPTFQERFRKVRSPKGLPFREWAYFLRKHGTVAWPLAWLSAYRHLVTGAPREADGARKVNHRNPPKVIHGTG